MATSRQISQAEAFCKGCGPVTGLYYRKASFQLDQAKTTQGIDHYAVYLKQNNETRTTDAFLPSHEE